MLNLQSSVLALALVALAGACVPQAQPTDAGTSHLESDPCELDDRYDDGICDNDCARPDPDCDEDEISSSCEVRGCGDYVPGASCQCASECESLGDCCPDYIAAGCSGGAPADAPPDGGVAEPEDAGSAVSDPEDGGSGGDGDGDGDGAPADGGVAEPPDAGSDVSDSEDGGSGGDGDPATTLAGENEPCSTDADCASELACVSIPSGVVDIAVCKEPCEEDADCSLGRSCLTDRTTDPTYCGYPEQLGEACDLDHAGPRNCVTEWEVDGSSAFALCLNGACAPVCSIEYTAGGLPAFDLSCPYDWTCGAPSEQDPELPDFQFGVCSE